MDKQTAALLGHLGRGGAAYYCHSDFSTSTWFDPARLIEPPAAANCYFGVHPTSAKRGKHQRGRIVDIAAINCLFAEFDAKDFGESLPAALAHVNALLIPPSVLVCSGGGYHAYWLLTDTVIVTDDNREALRQLQARWVGWVGGDPGAKDLARVLRVPGTLNAKYNPPRPVEFVWYDNDPFGPDDAERYLDVFGPPGLPAAPTSSLNASLPDLPMAMADGLTNTSPRAQTYGRAALGAELLALQGARPGQRNCQLNKSAFKLGSLVAGGLLDRREVVNGLYYTAQALGTDESFTEAQIRATIHSGLTAGLQHPRGVPNDRA